MSLDIRMSYNGGIDYVDLFPSTNVESVVGNKTNRTSFIFVTIPATSDVTQTISIAPSIVQSSSIVYMQLLPNYETEEEDVYNYQTINQYQVTSNSLILTRLYTYPTASINVALIFVENDDNVLNYSTIDVIIPAANSLIQSIPITPSASQAICPVYMELDSTGNQAQYSFSTISQFQVTYNSLIITRLENYPSSDIDVTLIFKQGGYASG